MREHFFTITISVCPLGWAVLGFNAFSLTDYPLPYLGCLMVLFVALLGLYIAIKDIIQIISVKNHPDYVKTEGKCNDFT